MLQEISLFLPNYPGVLAQLSLLLRANEIKIIAISVAQTKEYGLVMILVDKPSECIAILEENEYEYHVKEVVLINMIDKPEIINDIAEIMGVNDINIEYIYSTLVRRQKNEAYLILNTNNNEKATSTLKEKGFSLLESV